MYTDKSPSPVLGWFEGNKYKLVLTAAFVAACWNLPWLDMHVGTYHDWIAVVFIDENQVELNAKVTDALKDQRQAGIMVDDVEVLSTGEYDTADTEHYLC